MRIIDSPAVTAIHRGQYISRDDRGAVAARVREQLLEACAAAACVHGLGVLKDPTPIHACFPGTHDWYPDRGSIRYAKIGKSLRGRIGQGGLSVAGELRPWCPDFLEGLKQSGALRRESFRDDRRYQVWIPAHGALVADLQSAANLPKEIKVYATTPNVCRLSRCPALWLPPDNPKGAEVLAGLMAGSEMRVLDDGEEWMLVPDAPATRGLLGQWTIQSKPVKLPRRRAMVAVSPFFASLFCHMMPRRSAERILGCRRPGDGGRLAMLYWAVCFAERGMQLPPFANAIPFAVSPRTFRRRAIDRAQLHRVAVCEAGLANLSPGLRELLRRWYAEACAARQGHPSEPAEGAVAEAAGPQIAPHTVSARPAV